MGREDEELPYEENPGKTHYDGCYMHRGHHNCAVRKIQQLGQEVVGLRDEIQAMRDDLNLKPGEKPMKLTITPEGKLDISELRTPDVEKH